MHGAGRNNGSSYTLECIIRYFTYSGTSKILRYEVLRLFKSNSTVTYRHIVYLDIICRSSKCKMHKSCRQSSVLIRSHAVSRPD